MDEDLRHKAAILTFRGQYSGRHVVANAILIYADE
jgi:hypothetical protein